LGSCGQNGTSSVKATSSARPTSTWGMTAIAVVNKLPGIVTLVSLFLYSGTFRSVDMLLPEDAD